jgi:hypothetical protein
MVDYQFSRRTIIAAVIVLERMTQADLSRFLLELGPDFPQLAGGESNSVKKRLNNVISIVDQRPDRQTDEGSLLRDALVEKAISLLQSGPSLPPWATRVKGPDEASLTRCLELDGFTISEGTLRRVLPGAVELPQAETEIMRLLNTHGFSTPKGHLNQALDSHGRGNWAAANSQLRTFLEGLLDEMAEKLDPTARPISSGHARRAHLANIAPPFLERTLNEWGDNGVGFINGLMARLHPQGAHPGLSDEADSTFRLHVVLVTARLLLGRFDERMK